MADPTKEEMDRALLAVVAKIPATWACLVCGEVFQNAPGAPVPYAKQTKLSDDGQRIEIGEICAKCFRN